MKKYVLNKMEEKILDIFSNIFKIKNNNNTYYSNLITSPLAYILLSKIINYYPYHKY